MFTLNINDNDYQVDAAPETPLVWAIRDLVGLKGTKFGCGMGLCGSCTVHLDGSAIRSCITPISNAVGRKITTIEGLSEDGNHPVQMAWREVSVPQCGYCQVGQIMQAASFLKTTPNPSDQEIDDNMSGNLCRCGTYLRIKEAIKLAAKH